MREPAPLWDETDLTLRCLDAARDAERFPLRWAPRSGEPGAYLMFGSLSRHRLYGHATMSATGELPLYAGKARCLSERIDAHRDVVDAAADLDLEEFFVALLPVGSPEASVYVEALLIATLAPVWNVALPGLGSRRASRARETSRARRTPWGTLHPGRRWEQPLRSRDPEPLILAVRAHLRWQDRHLAPLWRPLTAVGARRSPPSAAGSARSRQLRRHSGGESVIRAGGTGPGTGR